MTEPAWATVRSSERLADASAVRRDGRWWLVAPSGAVPADAPVMAGDLDALAADMAAANRAVAQLTQGEPDAELG